MNRWLSTQRIPAVAAAFALVLVACSGGTDTADTTTTTAAAAPETTATTVTTAAPTTTVSAAPESTTTLAERDESRRRQRGAAQTGEPLPIPEPVDVAPATATRYGVIGCSNTDQAVRGYTEISSKDLIFGGDLGGGSVPRWGNPNNDRYDRYWALFDERRPAEGYDGVWVQLCMRTSDHGGVFDTSEAEWITHIVEQIHLRDPGIPIWISPINFYVEGYVCSVLGPDGPAIAAIAADWAATNLENVFRGPNFGPLSDREVGQRDDCHPNGWGEALLGQQLVDFIDQG